MVLLYVGIRTGLAMVLVYVWRVQHNYPPAKDWAIGALLSAAGLFLFALRGMAPSLLTNIVSNALLLPGVMLFDYGIVRAANGKPPLKSGLLLCIAALAALSWFTFVAPSYAAQVLTQNLLLVIFDLYVAHACLKIRQTQRTVTFRLIGGLFLILVSTCIWRVLGGLFAASLTIDPDLPRLSWIAVSLVIFPMVTALLILHTSQRLQDEINDQARHDTLTGAYNRRAFEEFTNREWSKSIRHGYPFSVLTVDIDHFKIFNDRHGHQTGDQTLIQVSHAAQATLRADDIWCRYGGEEFVAVLPNTTLAQALAMAERLRSSVAQTTIAAAGSLLNVSVSVGAAERLPTQTHWMEVLQDSDIALYVAKATGRNRVATSETPIRDA